MTTADMKLWGTHHQLHITPKIWNSTDINQLFKIKSFYRILRCILEHALT
jgi:hypothetical protein